MDDPEEPGGVTERLKSLSEIAFMFFSGAAVLTQVVKSNNWLDWLATFLNQNLSEWRVEETDVEFGSSALAVAAVVMRAYVAFVEPHRRKKARHRIRHEQWSLDIFFERVISEVRGWKGRECEWGEWSFSPRSVIEDIAAGFEGPITGSNKRLAVQLVADPGAGKTELLHHFLDPREKCADMPASLRNMPVLAYHFCRFDMPQTIHPREFAKHVYDRVLQSELRDRYLHHLNEKDRTRLLNELEKSVGISDVSYCTKDLIWEPLNRIGLVGGPNWLLIVDALDEAVTFEGTPNIRTLIELLLKDYAEEPLFRWLRLLVSTRPGDGSLPVTMPNVVQVTITEDSARKDIKRYVRTRLGANKILPLPEDDIDKIASAAGNNFLFARYLIREFLLHPERANELLSDLDNYIPGDVLYYYRQNFDRIFNERIPEKARLLKPAVKVLAVILAAVEPLSDVDLAKAAEIPYRECQNILDRLSAFCGRGDPGRNDGRIEFVHKSFSDWLISTTDERYRIDLDNGHRLLAEWCKKQFHDLDKHKHAFRIDIKGFVKRDHAVRYLLEHGIRHLMKAKQFPVAVEFVHFLLHYWDYSVAGEDPELGKISPGHLARAVLLGLPGRDSADWYTDKGAALEISPELLVDLVRSVYQIEPLRPALDLLIWGHPESWRKHVDACLIGDNFVGDNFVLRFKLAETLGHACREVNEVNTPISKADLIGYLGNADLNHAELGAFALGHLYLARPQEIDAAVLERLANNSETYALPQVFGEILLNLALQGKLRGAPGNDLSIELSGPKNVESRPAVRRDGISVSCDWKFWGSNWQHLQIDKDEINAAVAYFSRHEGDAPHCAHLKAADGLREKLENEKSLRNFQSIAPLLEKNVYFSLGANTARIDKIADDLARMPNAFRKQIMKMLFSHPAWSVGETAASALIKVYENWDDVRNDVIELIWDFLRKEDNWRINLGAVEAAYILAERDRTLFLGIPERQGTPQVLGAAEIHYKASSSRLRALCAEDLITYILERPPQIQLDLLKRFDQCVDWWIARDKEGNDQEDDCWVLEHIFRLLKTLDTNRRNQPQSAYSRYLDSMFTRITSRFLAGISDWRKISRGEFLARIENIKNGSDQQSEMVLQGA